VGAEGVRRLSRCRHGRLESLRRRGARGERAFDGRILIDQGLADKFLAEQLHPEAFEAACAASGQSLTLRRHGGYDHGYFFIATFVEEHLRHHAARLG
jgi:S-formylglutathione hydrolase